MRTIYIAIRRLLMLRLPSSKGEQILPTELPTALRCSTMNERKAEHNQLAGELVFEPRFSESESDVLPLNYSPTVRRKWLLCKEKSTKRRENIRDFLVAKVTICSR